MGQPLGPVADRERRIFSLLERACGSAFPGCVALVWDDGAERYHEAHGVLADHPQSPACGRLARRGSIYDLASLTKPLAAGVLAGIALSEGRVALDDPVPADLAPGLPGATFGHLLCHGAGLAAHEPLYAGLSGVDPAAARARLSKTRPLAPPGTRVLYSDLGFLFLGDWIERLFDRPLIDLFEDRVAGPLGLAEPTSERFVGYLPVGRAVDPRVLARIAPTERYTDRPDEAPPADYLALRAAVATEARGEVHDDNAYVLGGVAGHAGLFGTAAGVADLARALLDGRVPGLRAEVRDRLWRPCGIGGSRRRFAFDVPTEGGSTGGALDPDAVGHLGFTGTSFWIEPRRRRIYVLLSNRVYPWRDRAEAIAAVRRAFHRIAAGDEADST